MQTCLISVEASPDRARAAADRQTDGVLRSHMNEELCLQAEKTRLWFRSVSIKTTSLAVATGSILWLQLSPWHLGQSSAAQTQKTHQRRDKSHGGEVKGWQERPQEEERLPRSAQQAQENKIKRGLLIGRGEESVSSQKHNSSRWQTRRGGDSGGFLFD